MTAEEARAAIRKKLDAEVPDDWQYAGDHCANPDDAYWFLFEGEPGTHKLVIPNELWRNAGIQTFPQFKEMFPRPL